MSKKRPSRESGTDQKTNEGSESFQPDENAKRAKLISLSDTTLDDLPVELIEHILIEVIVMEVKDMKLAKCAWKQKADLVISRLRAVCSQWSNILTTNVFRKGLHRTLDSTAQETIRLEVLHQSPFVTGINLIATMKDEIFLFCCLFSPTLHVDYRINVYDRSDMATVKDVIPRPVYSTRCMVACTVSNCLYVLNRASKNKYNHFSVSSIAKDDGGRYTATRLIIRDMYLPDAGLCVSATGRLIVSRQQSIQIDAIRVFDANGDFLHTIRLPLDLTRYYRIVPKSNGNLVLVHSNDQDKTRLMEINMAGVIIRQYQSSLDDFWYVSEADKYGRLLISDHANGMKLLDAEFNPLDFSGLQLGEGQYDPPRDWRFNGERNEIIALASAGYSENHLLTICQLI